MLKEISLDLRKSGSWSEGQGGKEAQWSEACSRWKILSKIKEGNRITFRCSWRDKSDIMADGKPKTYPKIFGLSVHRLVLIYVISPIYKIDYQWNTLDEKIRFRIKIEIILIWRGEWILIHWLNPFAAHVWICQLHAKFEF